MNAWAVWLCDDLAYTVYYKNLQDAKDALKSYFLQVFQGTEEEKEHALYTLEKHHYITDVRAIDEIEIFEKFNGTI
jgi:hypothetical protein